MYEYCKTRVREIFYADKIIFLMSFSLNFYQLEAVGTGFIPANFDVYFTDAYGNVVSDIQKIIADKVSQENTERTFRCTFNLKAGNYSRNAEYFLIIPYRGAVPRTAHLHQQLYMGHAPANKKGL